MGALKSVMERRGNFSKCWNEPTSNAFEDSVTNPINISLASKNAQMCNGQAQQAFADARLSIFRVGASRAGCASPTALAEC